MKLVPEVSLERVIRAGLPTVVPFAANDLERTGESLRERNDSYPASIASLNFFKK
jgi:hypothetical protein